MPAENVAKADRFIRSHLDTARTKWITVRFLEGLSRTVAITSFALLVAFLADNAFALPGVARLALLAAVLAVLFGGLAWNFYSLAKRIPSDEAMARIVEKAHPEFDNMIINSVQLVRSGHKGPAAVIVAALANSAAAAVARFSFKGVVTLDRLKKLALVALAGLLLFAAYGLAMPDRFNNAFERFIRPLAWVPPLTDTHLEVEPGDATVGYGRPVVITARVSGKIPSTAVISFRARGEGKFNAQEMEFNGKDFVYCFSSVTEDIEYYVEAGDAESPVFTLDSVVLPAVADMTITLVLPAFTRLEPKVMKNASGSITAPAGTVVKIDGKANVSLGKAEISFNDGRVLSLPCKGKGFTAKFKVKSDGWYSIHLWDEDGVKNEDPPRHTITVVPDRPPQIRLIRPNGDMTVAPSQEVVVAYQASDDFGLAWIEVVFRLNGGDEKVADHWDVPPGSRLVVDQYIWKLAAFRFKPGDKVAWFLRVKDGGSNPPVMGRLLNLFVVSEEELLKRRTGLLEDLQAKLAALIRMQKEALGRTEKISALLEAGETDDFASRCRALAAAQEAVRLRCKAIIGELADPMFETLLIKPTLQRLYSGLMVTASEQVDALAGAAFDENRKKAADALAATQQAIIAELEKLLGRLPSIMAKLKQGMTPEEIAEEFPEKKLEWYKEKMKEFIEEQRKVIEMSRELERIPPEDWTDREREMQKEIEEIEEKWQKFFEENRDDFSKLPFQDFSDGSLIDEFVEIYEAVTVAYEAIKKSDFDIAVPVEQAGLEKAEKLEHNLEAWLPDTPDRDKWSMEEPPEQEEIPMAELPEELEDIVGDLIEEEEDMADDIEDISSSWTDSLDEGAGWDCLDGPISNMSAKGKTGNRMPNKSEIGGRSGEGRSGKASGQMVEKNATGKGGRETPTRLTKDPYEAGEVNDTSKDPVSGSTGGGKVSGQGGEGLQGPPPPEVKKELGRLAGQQAQLLARAEKLLHELRRRRFPTREVERAIEDLKEIEKQLREGAHRDLAGKLRAVVQKLRDARKTIDEQVRINRERLRRMPQRDREGISGYDEDEIPPDYKELVEEYYRALAEEEKKKGD